MKMFLILLFVSLSIFAHNIDTYAQEMQLQRDYNTALTKAQKENKVLVMVVGSHYCPWCRKFEQRTLNSALVKQKLIDAFVTLVVDNKYDAGSFPSKFQTDFVPMVFMINPKDETILIKTTGYKKKEEFITQLEFAQEFYNDAK